MPSDGEKLLAGYRRLDARMVAAGRHATSPTWMATLERFWLSGKRRLVVRKGRQGGGSTTLARVAVASALFGDYRAGPGTRLRFPFVSIRMDDARERLWNIADTLDCLGVKYTPRGDSIELVDEPRIFQVFPCSMRLAVGMTAGCAVEDEVARWWSDEANANPAVDVDASLTPSLATEPNARIYTCSSPVGLADFHASLIDRGETEDQAVADGPSWYWNPTISEADTRSLQPDPRRWAREFAAIPQAGALGCFDVADIERAFQTRERAARMGTLAVVIDWASGKKDRTTWCSFGWEQTAQPIMRVLAIGGIDANEARAIGSTAVVSRIAAFARTYGGIYTIHGDQRESFTLAGDFATVGMRFVEHTWTAASKPDAVESVRRWFREDRVRLPKHDRMKFELLNFEEKISPTTGQFTFAARGSGHDDYVSLLITAAMVSREGTIQQRQAKAETSRHARNAVILRIMGEGISSAELEDVVARQAIEDHGDLVAARLEWRTSGKEAQALLAWDERLRLADSPAWSGHVAAEAEKAKEREAKAAENEALHQRVIARLRNTEAPKENDQ